MKWVEGQIYFEEPPAVILPEHHPSTIRRVLTHLRRRCYDPGKEIQ